MTEHIQVKHQLVKTRYRIYVQGGEVYHRLKQRLEHEEFIYTPAWELPMLWRTLNTRENTHLLLPNQR